jgi:uncharacterized protein (TIGR02118 family)
MFRLAVLYPNTPGATFDYTYYTKIHMKLVREKLRHMGLKKLEVDKGIETAPSGSTLPYITIGYLFYKSLDDLKKASASKEMAELQADIPNFTNVRPQTQVSEVIM